MPEQFTDDQVVMDELRALGADVTYEPWDTEIDWAGFDAVAVRSPWDYSYRRDEFVAWAEAAGPDLHNSADLLRWNSDKSYVADLAEASLPVVETAFLKPGEAWAGDEREVIVKPSISAGARDTGRFGPCLHDEARVLIETIHGSGRTAMVQPYLASVDDLGETALVFIDGEFSHSLRKSSVLQPDEVAPVRSTDLMVAEAMYDPELVLAGTYEPDELELAEGIVRHITERFEYLPLYARVDMLRDADGTPVLLELEAVEPNLYFNEFPDGAGRLARAIAARAG
ncbi:MAG: hypothetical protein QOI31_251 [Solirubrobacterales bacterium]|jgi:hypothetical protein|nr:hypothetical protein [Solirubrobacterales bacterium]